MIKETIDLLGLQAEDKITGTTGIIDSVCFDLYGCVNASLTPRTNKDGELPSARWFDVARLKVTKGKRVMAVPTFSKVDKPSTYDKGPATKAPPKQG